MFGSGNQEQDEANVRIFQTFQNQLIDCSNMFLSFFRKKLGDGKQKLKDVDPPKDSEEIKDMIYDLLRNIKDPEKPNTLEELGVIYEDGIFIKAPTGGGVNVIRVEFNPTVPHCSLATLIGLCIRVKLQRDMPFPIKLNIFIKEGAHTTEHEINKQINDKERIAAAMENPNLREIVETCIKDED
ncbi:hypothetical protein YQE_00668, partial [Dendroctonus ponderosae]